MIPRSYKTLDGFPGVQWVAAVPSGETDERVRRQKRWQWALVFAFCGWMMMASWGWGFGALVGAAVVWGMAAAARPSEAIKVDSPWLGKWGPFGPTEEERKRQARDYEADVKAQLLSLSIPATRTTPVGSGPGFSI